MTHTCANCQHYHNGDESGRIQCHKHGTAKLPCRPSAASHCDKWAAKEGEAACTPAA
jgi:hypothetical protein